MIAKSKSHNRVRIDKSSSKGQHHQSFSAAREPPIDNSAEQTMAPSTIRIKTEPNSGFDSLL